MGDKDQKTIAKRHRAPLPLSDASPTDFDLIAALLLLSAPAATAASLNDDRDSEDERCTATLLLLRLAYVQGHAQLTSIAQELELLRSAPPLPPDCPGTSSDPYTSTPTPSLAAKAAGRAPLLSSLIWYVFPFSLLHVFHRPYTSMPAPTPLPSR
ncbi:hypothetical protein BC827DRAFT_1375832 [Russula dissimulans]|nr:hypothetical protein BC827DRAFT_1375832 [Russula dissimulans]